MPGTPLRSMTGFGEAERGSAAGRLRAEIRTVNHRYLNVQIRSPGGFERHHPAIEKTLRAHFSRGHVSLSLSVERDPADEAAVVEIDLERARGYHAGLVRIRDELGLEGSVDLGTLAGFRDLFQVTQGDREAPPVDLDEARAVVDAAAREVQATREAEGARLAEDLSQRLEAMETVVAGIEDRAPERLVEERDRLRTAVAELLDGTTGVDEDRIAREVAHLAERWDIHEEVVRFRSHLSHFRDTLREGSDEGVGKRFGFIAQEMLREANTIGSKGNDAVIARSVVTLKNEIERLREQLENVE